MGHLAKVKLMLEDYKAYAIAVRRQDWTLARMYAMAYNRRLKALGGPKRNPGEDYLSMGKPDYVLPK